MYYVVSFFIRALVSRVWPEYCMLNLRQLDSLGKTLNSPLALCVAVQIRCFALRCAMSWVASAVELVVSASVEFRVGRRVPLQRSAILPLWLLPLWL